MNIFCEELISLEIKKKLDDKEAITEYWENIAIEAFEAGEENDN